MLLLELLGIDAAPGRSKYHRRGTPLGRPNEHKERPRPKRNLWFKDDKLWMRDLDHARERDYALVASEDEETVIACNDERTMAYGKWSNKDGKGITYYKPRPIYTAINPKIKLKDFKTP